MELPYQEKTEVSNCAIGGQNSLSEVYMALLEITLENMSSFTTQTGANILFVKEYFF